MAKGSRIAAAERRVSVLVTYELWSQRVDEFLQLAWVHAARTLKQEPDCLQYDVVLVSESLVAFYEQYTSMAAFKQHQASASLAEFRSDRAPLVKSHTTVVGCLMSTAGDRWRR